MAHDVFISYSSRNKPVADAVCAGLEADGIRCWIAPRDVLPGQNYGESIVHAIAACKVMVLVFSEATNVSQAVIREAERAMHNSKPIIPFRIEDVPMSPGLEFFLASCHWLDAMTPPLDSHIDSLALSVKRLMGEEVVRKPVETTPPAPKPAAKRPWWIAGAVVIAATAAFLAWPKGKPEAAPVPSPVVPNDAASLSLDLSLAGTGSGAISSHFSGGEGPRYESTEANGKLIIESKGGPLLGKVSSVRPAGKGTWLRVPTLDLDLKLLNQGTKTVFFQRASLEVKSSKPVPGTAWLVDGSRLGKVFAVKAFGDSPESPPKLSISIAGPEDEIDATKLPPPLTTPEGDDGVWEFPLPASPKTGVEEVLFGRLNDVSFEFPFKPLPAGKSPSPVKEPEPLYEIELRAEGADYTASCDLSQSIQAGEGDRFFLRLHSPSLARHEFKLILEYNDGSGGDKKLTGPAVEALILPTR